MDAISYSYADKQAKRIKKIINDPDSTSGVITVPKVIESTENVTIPSGRIAVLPNVQIDGTLNVQGDVFIPSGTTMSKVVEKVTSTDNAIVRFNGTTGDVQNSGVIIDDSDRLLVGNTPSGLNTLGQLIVNQPSSGAVNLALTNKTNDAYSYIYNDGTALKIINSYNSTAGFKPIILQAGGSDRFTLDVNGNVGIGVTPSAWGSAWKTIQYLGGSLATPNSNNNLLLTNAYNDGTNYRYVNTNPATNYQQSNGQHIWYAAPSGTAGNAITWTTAMTLDANGNLLVGTTTDNGVDKLQVNGSINCNNKIVYQNSIIGTFTGDVWYDTGVTINTLRYNILDTFAITIYEDSYGTGNNNYQMLYKFIVGSASNSSNSGNTFDIPTLSAVGHAHNGGSVSLRWQHLHSSQPQKIQFKVTYTSTFDDSPGKSLKIYVTKLI